MFEPVMDMLGLRSRQQRCDGRTKGDEVVCAHRQGLSREDTIGLLLGNSPRQWM